MSGKNPESRLWQKVKLGLNQCFLTRINLAQSMVFQMYMVCINKEYFG